MSNAATTMTPPKRVLVVIDSLLLGGAERCAVEFACALDRSRYVPHVLVTRYGGPLEETLKRRGVEYTILSRNRRIDARAARATRSLVRSSDIVHAHKLGGAAWIAVVARRERTPLVVHEHNWAGEQTWRTALLRRLVIAPRSGRVLCVSDSVHRAVLTDGIDPRIVTTLTNAVEFGVALDRKNARRALQVSERDWVVGMVAGLRPEKAHELAIEALADQRLRDRGIRLCVVGSGPRSKELRALANTLGVEEQIIWCGAVDDVVNGDRMVSAGAAYSGAFDAALVCSKWEGLPLFALEAMAAKTPMVSTRVGELPRVLGDERGILVPIGDSTSIADSLCALYDDSAGATTMAQRAYEYLIRIHSHDVLVRDLQQIYDEVLGLGPATSTATSAVAA